MWRNVYSMLVDPAWPVSHLDADVPGLGVAKQIALEHHMAGVHVQQALQARQRDAAA
jgi:hypothetical protein